MQNFTECFHCLTVFLMEVIMGGCYIYDTKDSLIHSFRNCEGARPTLTPWALGPGMLFQFKSWCKKGDRRSLMIELLRLKGNGVQYMALPWFAQYILYTKISFKLIRNETWSKETK